MYLNIFCVVPRSIENSRSKSHLRSFSFEKMQPDDQEGLNLSNVFATIVESRVTAVRYLLPWRERQVEIENTGGGARSSDIGVFGKRDAGRVH